MTTRAGFKWLVFSSRAMLFVARSDSPIAGDVGAWSWCSDFEFDTLEEAYAELARFRIEIENGSSGTRGDPLRATAAPRS